MSSIVSFYILYPRKAVYNTIREITINVSYKNSILQQIYVQFCSDLLLLLCILSSNILQELLLVCPLFRIKSYAFMNVGVLVLMHFYVSIVQINDSLK